MKFFIISIIQLCLVSCSDYTPYKSKLIGSKFKSKNAFIYLKNLNQDRYSCYGSLHKVPLWLSELRFEENVIDSWCIFSSSTVRAELVPIGTEFEIKDSFMPGSPFVNKYIPVSKVEYLILKDNAGNLSESIEIFIDMKIRSTRTEEKSSGEEGIVLQDLDYLKKNKKLDIVLCNMFHNASRPEKYPDYDEENNNKSSVLLNTPYIELNIANFIKNFGFENEVKILELSWIKKERNDPCVLLEFKTEQSYLTSMYLMGRHWIPISNRYFGLQEKFENIGNSKFYYYNKLIENSEWNKFRSDYKKMDIGKMSSKDIYNYKRSVAPTLNN